MAAREKTTWNKYALHSKELFTPQPEYERTKRLAFNHRPDDLQSTRCIDGLSRPRRDCILTELGWVGNKADGSRTL